MEKLVNIPKLRFPEFEGEWEKKKLGEISDKIMYGMNSAAIEFDGENKYLRITDIDENSREFIPKPLVSPDGVIDEKYKLKSGDIVFTRTGASVGKTYLYKPNDGNLLFAGFLIKFSISHGDPYFIFTQTLKENYNKWVLKMSMRSGQPGLNAEECKELELSFPTLPEQQKIASFLNAVDEKLQAIKKNKSLLEQYKKGVMQKIFSQKIRFKDDDGREFPDWEEKKLGEIGSFQTSSIDKLTKENEKEVYLVNYMNVYRHESLNNETIKTFQIVTAKDSQIGSCNLNKGDILFTPSSETPDDIGHSVVIFEDLECAVFSYHLMRFRPSIAINILYSHYFCNIPSVLAQLTKLATGSTRFTISVKSFSSIEIKLPSLPEQTKIANFLSALDDKISHVQMQVERMELWKKGLLQQMFI